MRPDGVELEYDLPDDSTAEDRLRNWQFPTRVWRPLDGPLQLRNAAELAARVDGWLKAFGMTRAICGKWIFTWNAFRIDCDPQMVLKTIEGYSFNPAVVAEGTPYAHPDARAPGRLKRQSAREGGAVFIAQLVPDGTAVIRAQADTDLLVAEVSGKKLTLAEALRNHASERISGSITVTLDTDAAGEVWRRTTVTKLEVAAPDGKVEHREVTETLKRRRIARRLPADA